MFDLTGQVAIVTGSTHGIAARGGAVVLMASLAGLRGDGTITGHNLVVDRGTLITDES